jgi:hypothetical protein
MCGDHNHSGDHIHDRADGHHHDSGHHHRHPAGEHPPAGGPVVLNIGDGYGALIVRLDSEWFGQEIHVRRPDETATTHTGVWERNLNGRGVTVAVFPELATGTWLLLDRSGEVWRELEIIDGWPVELDLSSQHSST